MDLFTYLMAKNGNNSSVHGDLFSYLLGKAQGGGGQIKTASGITIYIPDATRTGIVSFMMTKESTQATTTGIQMLDLQNGTTSNEIIATINNGEIILNGTTTAVRFLTIGLKNNLNLIDGNQYTISTNNSVANSNIRIRIDSEGNYDDILSNINSSKTITYSSNIDYFNNKIQIRVASGVTLNDFKIKPMIELGSTVNEWEEYTGGQPSPNPDYPVPVNVVEGYRNLFDKSTENVGKFISSSNGSLVSVSAWNTSEYIEVNSNLKYILSAYEVANSQFAFGEYTSNQTFINRIDSTGDRKSFILNLNPNTKYIRVSYRNDKVSKEIQLTEGDQELPYVPYGNNYIAVNISDGTNTNSVLLPLNGNEIAGIGNYLDEYIVDKSGHCWLNKKTGKVVLDGSENWGIGSNEKWFYYNNTLFPMSSSGSVITPSYSNYYLPVSYNQAYGGSVDYGFAFGYNVKRIAIRNKDITTTSDFKTWLSTHNTEVYYPLETPDLIDLNTTVDLKLFKGVNNVSNSEDGYMTIEYR